MDNQPIAKKSPGIKSAELNRYFLAVIKMKASDLHFKGDETPRIRTDGILQHVKSEPISEEHLEKMIFEILSPEQKEYFIEHGVLDFAYDMGGTDRFRINIYRCRGNIALAARRVDSVIPPFASLNLPPIIEKISDVHQGLILVTGVTGCGKSTTIAAMIDYINRTRPCHIITIEDPIEFVYHDAKALISQREVGIDVPSYTEALRSMMREDPDVVLIGEMRDYPTISAGLKAAETGHLVFGTLHSVDAYQTITRMLDLVPPLERHIVRQALVGNLHAVISQRLLPSVKEGISRVPMVEIMLANPSICKVLAEEREVDIPTIIKSCYEEGMIDYTESLRQLVMNEFIDMRTAFEYAFKPEELKMALKGIRSGGAGLTR